MVDPTRRDVLSAVSTLGVAAMLPGVLPACSAPDGPPGPGGPVTKRRSDLIRDENERPGTKDWVLTKPAIDHAVKHRCDALGHALTRLELDQVYRLVIAKCDAQKTFSDDDLKAVFGTAALAL